MNLEHTQFAEFIKAEKLTPLMAKQFHTYLQELQVWNEQINLTAITDEQEIINYHFKDSLIVRQFVDVSSVKMLADVGSGGGFPGIPLKICFPDLPIILIEVNTKKVRFLEHMIATLKLSGIELYTSDWRTFLRKTEYPIDIFCARASLQPSELLRIFKPNCIYKEAQLIYWASRSWKPEQHEELFIAATQEYVVGNKKRKLIFFKK